MKLIDFIDCIYYINIDTRTDKNEEAIRQLTELGLIEKVKRFNAIKPTDIGCKLQDNGLYTVQEYSRCAALSHFNIIKDATENKFKNILVFEDDFHFLNDEDSNALDNIEKALDQLQDIKDWDIFFVGGNLIDSELKYVSDNIIKINEIVCSHAYILNERSYQNVLSQYDNTIFIDCYLSQHLKHKYVVSPVSVIQKYVNSVDIILENRNFTPDVTFWKESYNKPKIRITS
jgi:GR25 family glycosyltransferase involved in LPS biosynthesis